MKVKKDFPGEIARYGGSNGTMLHLNEEQKEWLRECFPVTENRIIAEAMGISINRLHAFARELGLKKSEAGLKAIRKRQSKRMARTCEERGVYDRKRGHPASESTLEGIRRRWQLVREGKVDSPRASMKRERPRAYRKMLERMSESRKELIRKEKRRVLYGMDRKTKLRTIVLCPYKSSQIAHRYNALRRGYLLDEDCSEGSPGRYVIYYDDETQRSEIFEKNCIADGFAFKRDEQ